MEDRLTEQRNEVRFRQGETRGHDVVSVVSRG